VRRSFLLSIDLPTIDWFGCYDNGWQSAPLVPEAYAHPAKIPFGLAERIYRHMLAEGWLTSGMNVIDPFGGIGGCAFHAALYGMHWTGVELESKFVGSAWQNIILWQDRYGSHFPGYGWARIFQGDSRRLREIVDTADASISSPPYAASEVASRAPSGIDIDARKAKRAADDWSGYGATPGNLGNLAPGDYQGVVSSPPYGENTVHDGNGIDASKLTGNRPGQHSQALTMTGYSGVVSSPPYENSRPDGDFQRHAQDPAFSLNMPESAKGYGDSGIGRERTQEASDTFWLAARTILEQTHSVLRPGAVAAWITGDFVRNKQRVTFGQQWLALCETVGFVPLAHAVAWKQTDHGAQMDIFGQAVPQGTTKVSFFRRLSNAKNPDAAILNEDIWFVRKPNA
jgi:tRNA G10  N-methylase Trm11